MARKPAHTGRIDATLGEIVRPHRLDARAASERQVRQLVRGIVGARGDDAVARTEVERGHRLAEGHGRVLDDGYVPGRRAHQTPQQLVRLAYAGLCFIGCFIAADRRFPLEEPDERLKHRLRHERGTRVVEVDPLPASRRLAAPAVQLGWDGRRGGGPGGHGGKVAGWAFLLKSHAPSQEFRLTPGASPGITTRTDCAPRTTHSPAARRAAACTTGTSASHS